MSYRSRRYVAASLAVALVIGACDSNNESDPEAEHTPASAKLFIAGTDTELTPVIALVSGETTRVEVRFYHDGGDLITVPAGHQTSITLTDPTFGTVSPVAGETFQRDVAVTAAAGASTTVTVGYGHDAEADELTFGPFTISAVSGAASSAASP